MDDLLLLDKVERYLRNEMNEVEKTEFELLRNNNPDIDQLVVDQHAFLNQLEKYGQQKEMKHLLHQTHSRLLEQNLISPAAAPAKPATVIEFWKRYKRTIAVAASIAGVTALSISAAMQLFAPKASQGYLQNLSKKVNALENRQNAQNQKINQLITSPNSKIPETEQLSAGTSFLIDGDGYLATNFHVINEASTLVVVNNGHEYIAKTVYTDVTNDLAILKIEDKDWKSVSHLPYGIRKNNADLGEELFTLGYPRNTIVYNRGYLSAGTGYNDDSLSIQLSISANPGNSGGPVLDKNGNIIGILSTRDRQSDAVVFATKAVNINKAIEEMRKNTEFKDLQIPSKTSIRNMDRVDQIKKLQDCVFMVKAY
ncbi:MAG TPA: serine protease [Phnomibacter sp.]|nr:serine protease [Phnomibacter sp.]